MSSKTLVIHPDDRSTDFLKLIYKDKDYSVLTDFQSFTRRGLKNHMDAFDRIIMLGHGTTSGLINPLYYRSMYCTYPYVIDYSFADLLKNKQSISIWCNSDGFYEANGISDGNLHTGMIISEVSEQKYVLGKIVLDKEEQLKNMELFATVVGECIDMESGTEMVKYILKKYKGLDRVTRFNRKNIKVM